MILCAPKMPLGDRARSLGIPVGVAIGGTSPGFRFPWRLLVICGAAIISLCMSAAAPSIRSVLVLEPAVAFRT